MRIQETGHLQQRLNQALQVPVKNAGARGGTRTPTPLLASGPKPGASTNFATRAYALVNTQTGSEEPAQPSATPHSKPDSRQTP